MKRVIKGAEPASFTDWKGSANDNWSPTYPTLQNPQKRELLEALLLEQGSFCCYCGRDIDTSTSHIDISDLKKTSRHLRWIIRTSMPLVCARPNLAIHCIAAIAREAGLMRCDTFRPWLKTVNCASGICEPVKFSPRPLKTYRRRQ